jgi:hypothetical protein
MPRLLHVLSVHHPNNNSWGVQFKKPLLMQFFSSLLLLPRSQSKTLPQKTHSRRPSVHVLPLMRDTKFHTLIKQYKNYSLVHFKIYVFR